MEAVTEDVSSAVSEAPEEQGGSGAEQNTEEVILSYDLHPYWYTEVSPRCPR